MEGWRNSEEWGKGEKRWEEKKTGRKGGREGLKRCDKRIIKERL